MDFGLEIRRWFLQAKRGRFLEFCLRNYERPSEDLFGIDITFLEKGDKSIAPTLLQLRFCQYKRKSLKVSSKATSKKAASKQPT